MTTVRRTRRWRGIVGVALAAVAVGVVAAKPSVVVLSAVGIAFAAYPNLLSAPQVTLELERSVDADEATQDDEINVTVRVRNVGQDTITDLRIIDGVPPMLEVTGGTPRHAATLRPGNETTFTYTVRAAQGTHRFEPATVIARDLAGMTEVETQVAASDTADRTIECLVDVPEVPLRRQTHEFVGEIVTDEGGVGVEFHQTRKYQRGDALSRVDWNSYASTGTLSTIEFREERGAAVVLCLDTREPAYRTDSQEHDKPHGVAYARTAAEQVLEALSETHATVGLASLSDREACWHPTGASTDHLERARELLREHPSLSTYPPSEADHDRWDEHLTTLRARLRSEAQVVLFSPLADGFAVEAALTLEAAGHAVTVVSPDVSTDGSVGAQLARTERNNHIHALRQAGVRVVDWPPDDPLGAVLMRTQERWSQ